MQLGFETIGNATLICHDEGPLLVTDPWLVGSAYFGSWTLSHAIPDEQMESIRAARYVWISHGHPDHLSSESLELLRGKPILLADHVGGRVADGLREAGHDVRVLADGTWTELSPRVRVACIADYAQDATLLVDLGGTLVVDANDASDRGGGDFLRRTAAKYDRSWLLCLTGFGDADMIHFYDEDGRFVPPLAAERTDPGPGILGHLRYYGIREYVPFATMHKYQRSDSAWANAYTTKAADFARGFEAENERVWPPFQRVDLARDEVTSIDPPPTSDDVHAPEEFGDDWSEELAPGERDEIAAYLRPIEHLSTFLGRVDFRVGGKSNVIDVAPDRFDRGIVFEVPRSSLMTAVRYRVFDDLLIGNFMRTSLQGEWQHRDHRALYPDFSPFVGKYGDNGGARSAQELGAYFRAYRERGYFGPGPGTDADYATAERYLDA